MSLFLVFLPLEQDLTILLSNGFFVFFNMEEKQQKLKYVDFLSDGNGGDAVQQGGSSGGSEAARWGITSWEHRIYHCWWGPSVLQNR